MSEDTCGYQRAQGIEACKRGIDTEGPGNPVPVNDRTIEHLHELKASNSHYRITVNDMEKEIKALHGQIDALKAALKAVL